MKKLFFAAYTFTLAVLAPAVFIGYLHSNGEAAISNQETKIEKTVSTTDEATAHPVSMMVIVF